MAEDFVRNKEFEQEYNPTPNVDESGHSVSSEGSIANHGIFNAATDAVPPPKNPGKQNKRAKSPTFKPDQAAKPMQSKKTVKQILYSDKSETSVEELMDDTPSNYNIQNGRFEGKSLGLKALLLHAKNTTSKTIDQHTKGFVGGDRSP